MSDTLQSLAQLAAEAKARIDAAQEFPALAELRAAFLGKKGVVTAQLKRIAEQPAESRRDFGKAVNQLKQTIEQHIDARSQSLELASIEASFEQDSIDVTQPGRGSEAGTLHPLTRTLERIEHMFSRIGFEVASGPEIEDSYHNFEALNMSENHPARAMHDSFYISDHVVLRTHTSPVQIRYMSAHKPPLRVIAPGRVYRRDSDVTHTPMFHQVEGLAIDTDLTFADLKGVLIYFVQEFFEKELPLRFRPSYFPFTEPSVEVDMGCVFCAGKGCRVCKHTGWLEVLGCGMVHPRVLAAGGIDSAQYTGYAFGLGVERFTMLRYGVNDLRLFFANDLAFLRQF